METSVQQLINAWHRNQQANIQVIEELNEHSEVSAELRTLVYSEFCHVHTIRYYNIEKQNKDRLHGLQKLSGKNAEDESLIHEQLTRSAKNISEIVKDSDGSDELKSYSNGSIGWITYLINHESHHRCKAIMAMKNEGLKFTKLIKFDLWNWK